MEATKVGVGSTPRLILRGTGRAVRRANRAVQRTAARLPGLRGWVAARGSDFPPNLRRFPRPAPLPSPPASSLSLNAIQAPIAAEMAAFEPKFRAAMQSRVRLLDQIMGYIVRRKGKQMRPMFVFLTARLCYGAAGELPEASYRGAALIELLHTATLVHDDVVDEANYRRGFFSINALWKNKIAVLVGDYLLSKGLLLSIDHGDFELLRLVSTAVREMSEGELLQLEKARSLDITEDVYFEVIRQKTASLIAACCAVGAASTGADAATVARARRFGELTGLAFQLKDDLFDYGPLTDSGLIGKPVGIDIKEKKLTLPLIHALRQTTWLERRRLLYVLKNNTGQRAEIEQVMRFVQTHGGLTYATARMQALAAEAQAVLAEFPDSPARQALSDLLRYTIEREK